uniref:Uncharacterized protein n=1 Tax=Rhizophora mucronata TaxID=61149 RepID=A0A2P2NFF9_RHIMU
MDLATALLTCSHLQLNFAEPIQPFLEENNNHIIQKVSYHHAMQVSLHHKYVIWEASYHPTLHVYLAL